MIKFFVSAWFLFAFVFFISSCYYDNKEELYIIEGICDTTAITFSQHVQPIIDDQCVSCHKAGNASGNVLLDSYAAIKKQADNGKLLACIRHESGYSAMPPGSMLSSCSIAQLEAWVNNGSPEN